MTPSFVLSRPSPCNVPQGYASVAELPSALLAGFLSILRHALLLSKTCRQWNSCEPTECVHLGRGDDCASSPAYGMVRMLTLPTYILVFTRGYDTQQEF